MGAAGMGHGCKQRRAVGHRCRPRRRVGGAPRFFVISRRTRPPPAHNAQMCSRRGIFARARASHVIAARTHGPCSVVGAPPLPPFSTDTAAAASIPVPTPTPVTPSLRAQGGAGCPSTQKMAFLEGDSAPLVDMPAAQTAGNGARTDNCCVARRTGRLTAVLAAGWGAARSPPRRAWDPRGGVVGCTTGAFRRAPPYE